VGEKISSFSPKLFAQVSPEEHKHPPPTISR